MYFSLNKSFIYEKKKKIVTITILIVEMATPIILLFNPYVEFLLEKKKEKNRVHKLSYLLMIWIFPFSSSQVSYYFEKVKALFGISN